MLMIPHRAVLDVKEGNKRAACALVLYASCGAVLASATRDCSSPLCLVYIVALLGAHCGAVLRFCYVTAPIRRRAVVMWNIISANIFAIVATSYSLDKTWFALGHVAPSRSTHPSFLTHEAIWWSIGIACGSLTYLGGYRVFRRVRTFYAEDVCPECGYPIMTPSRRCSECGGHLSFKQPTVE